MSTNKTKRLTLVRHGSAEQDSDVRDFERPLSRKGQNEALEMARRPRNAALRPDLILTSAATRAGSNRGGFRQGVRRRAPTAAEADDARCPPSRGGRQYPDDFDTRCRPRVSSGISWSSSRASAFPPPPGARARGDHQRSVHPCGIAHHERELRHVESSTGLRAGFSATHRASSSTSADAHTSANCCAPPG